MGVKGSYSKLSNRCKNLTWASGSKSWGIREGWPCKRRAKRGGIREHQPQFLPQVSLFSHSYKIALWILLPVSVKFNTERGESAFWMNIYSLQNTRSLLIALYTNFYLVSEREALTLEGVSRAAPSSVETLVGTMRKKQHRGQSVLPGSQVEDIMHVSAQMLFSVGTNADHCLKWGKEDPGGFDFTAFLKNSSC